MEYEYAADKNKAKADAEIKNHQFKSICSGGLCQNKKWRFELITNVTIFAALLKKIPMGCPDYALRHKQVICFLYYKDSEPYKYHLRIFRALAMYMNGQHDLDSYIFRYFTEFITKSGYDPKNFRGGFVEDLPVVEKVVQKASLYTFLMYKSEIT